MSDLTHVHARIWLNRKDSQLWLLVRCPFRNPFAGFAYKSTPEEQLAMHEAMTRLSVDQNLTGNILAAYADKELAQCALALPELNHQHVENIIRMAKQYTGWPDTPWSGETWYFDLVDGQLQPMPRL